MKHPFLFFCAVTLPVFLLLNVWQVQRHERLRREVTLLQQEQREWVEKNKRVISGIAVLSSPARITELAQKELGLSAGSEGPTLHIVLSDARGGRSE